MKRVLVLSPHPDDEAIGCGGTICRHVAEGDEVHVVFLTSGEKGGHGLPPDETRRVREGEAAEAARILGVRSIEFWGEPDGGLEATTALLGRLQRRVVEWPPRLVYAPHPRDAHRDHVAVSSLVQRWHRTTPPSDVDVRLFEIWTPIQKMAVIVDISQFIERKLEAIRAYRSQVEVVDLADAARGLARYRGALHCWPEGDYAEVFARVEP